ncbi:hypothetical protein CGZ96_18295 [Enemella evansiae]|uniref:hypothetical protein n=1 Tax=Enemella evansiae TaxID=2016499 RepID=UPI000B96607D|nr:hypothetical protein [Enemella evansiae]OYN94308.1 hypothetical protein CGZ96_18295 [Enemella evansiae]
MSENALASAQASFRDELVRAGLLLPTGSEGVYGLGERFEQVVQQVQSAIADALDRLLPADALRPIFPPLYPRAAYERTDYIASFPNLTGAINSFTGGDREHRALLAEREHSQHWDGHLTPTDLMLVPAVCHPLYGTLPTELPAAGVTAELTGWCFRHEPSVDPARLQTFRMHEIVRVGSPDQTAEHLRQWQEAMLEVLTGLGLEVDAVAANDPFFGRAGRVLATNQRAEQLKTEFVVRLYGDLDQGTAIASANNHQTHFGDTFGLRLADGSPASSACVGFGLERIALAVLRRSGTPTGALQQAGARAGE